MPRLARFVAVFSCLALAAPAQHLPAGGYAGGAASRQDVPNPRQDTAARQAHDCALHCKGRCFSGRCLFDDFDLDEGAAAPKREAASAPHLRGGDDALGLQPWQLAVSMAGAANSDSTQALVDRLNLAETVAAKLADENAVLRQQLDSWHKVGEKVAARDASLGELVAQMQQVGRHEGAALAPAAAAGAANASQPALVQRAPAPSGADKGAAPEGQVAQISHSSLHPSLAMLSARVAATLSHPAVTAAGLIPLVASLFLLFLFREQWQPAMVSVNVGDKGALQTIGSRGGHSTLSPFSRALGVSEYCVEISEIRLGNISELQLAGKASLVVFLGSTKVAQTLAVPLGSSMDTLAFQEVLRLNVSRFGGPLHMTVCDQDLFVPDGAAQLNIRTSDFLRKACDRQEYFTFPLSPIGREAPWKQEHRPVLAMRIQDVSHLQAAQPGHPMRNGARGGLPRYG